MLVDSTIFIHYLRGKKQAREFLTNPPETLSTSVIVVMEIVAGLKKRDLTDSFFAFLQKNNIKILYISKTISHDSFNIFIAYHHRGLGIADSLIAATALNNSGALVTHNKKHFKPIPNLKLLTPYLTK